jgi:hypothetical protein
MRMLVFRCLGIAGFISGFVLVVVLAPHSLLSAQTATPSGSAVELKTVVPITQQLQTLRETYRNKLSEYRNNERDFTIAKEQFIKLQTLNSLEDAVRSTQKVMISRAEVLETYFGMVKLSLTNTQGLDQKVKGEQLVKIDLLLDTLKLHRVQVESSLDRKKIGQMVIKFAEIQPDIERITYESLSLIAFGEMQGVYNDTVGVKNEVKAYVDKNETNALRLAEKKRGIDEITTNLVTVKAQLDKINGQISETRTQKTQSFYSQVTEDLSAVYGGLSRAQSYLTEVMK